VKKPYQNLIFLNITQNPSLPHIQEITRLIEDAAQQEAKIQRLEAQLESVSCSHQAVLTVLCQSKAP